MLHGRRNLELRGVYHCPNCATALVRLLISHLQCTFAISTAAARQSNFKDAARMRRSMCLVTFSLAYSRHSGIVFAI